MIQKSSSTGFPGTWMPPRVCRMIAQNSPNGIISHTLRVQVESRAPVFPFAGHGESPAFLSEVEAESPELPKVLNQGIYPKQNLESL